MMEIPGRLEMAGSWLMLTCICNLQPMPPSCWPLEEAEEEQEEEERRLEEAEPRHYCPNIPVSISLFSPCPHTHLCLYTALY